MTRTRITADHVRETLLANPDLSANVAEWRVYVGPDHDGDDIIRVQAILRADVPIEEYIELRMAVFDYLSEALDIEDFYQAFSAQLLSEQEGYVATE